ncbi:MAG: substrate-binding domain-containing protein [Desulforhopalus sp.]
MGITKRKILTWILLLLGNVVAVCCPMRVVAGNEHTVALVVKSLSNPFYSSMAEEARKYAAENKVPFEVFGVESETDVDRQIGIVENLIARGYRAIILAPVDSKKLIPVCRKAVENNIVVINVETPLHRPTMERLNFTVPFIGSDGFAGGKKIGRYIRHRLKGQGRVLIIEGSPGAQSSELRKAGFVEAVTEDSSIEIVSSEKANWNTDEAFSVTIKFLSQNPPPDAIFCVNDEMVLGALQAIDLLGVSQPVLLAGYNDIESVRVEMRGGRIHATMEQHPEIIGRLGVEAVMAKINGLDVPSLQSTPLDLITSENFGKTIVFSVSTLQNSFFSIMVKGAKDAAELVGFQLVVLDAGNQDTRQLSDIARVLSRQTDLLILNPTNSDSIYPGVELANSRGIPVITVDRKSVAGEVLCHIESDNTEGGRIAARVLAKLLDYHGTVFELEGIPGTSASHERGEGFNEVLKNYGNIKVAFREVANFDRQEATEVTTRFLEEQHILVDGVFAHNDNMILGFIDACEASDKPLPKVLIGFDAIPEAREAIRKGQLTATIAQQPEALGELAVTTAARYFRGEEIPEKIFTELSLITE